MNLEIKNRLLITEIPDHICREIMEKLTFPNPAYADAVKMGRWTGKIPQSLCFYQNPGNGLVVPRGFLDQAIILARKYGITYKINDRSRTLLSLNFDFTGTLKPFQQDAVSDMASHNFGTLSAPTGSGKTVMAMALIAQRRQPTLIIVHTKELLNQWIERIEQFLNIPKKEIGIIMGGKKLKIGDKITVGIVNSIYPDAKFLSQFFGHVIVDECHRCPSRTFTQAVTAFDSRYLLGLSATPYRRDGLSKLIGWFLGECHHIVDRNVLQSQGDIVSAEVFIKHTRFLSRVDPSGEYSKMLSELTQDHARNTQIAADVVKEAGNGGGTCLVLTDRREHAERLWTLIVRQGIKADVLTGDLPSTERQEIIDRLNAGNLPVVVATGQLIGEGFDCKGLSTLFMATPISYEGRVIQYLGRVLRPAPGKTLARVYDYRDENVGVLRASADKRQQIYENNKWRVT